MLSQILSILGFILATISYINMKNITKQNEKLKSQLQEEKNAVGQLKSQLYKNKIKPFMD